MPELLQATWSGSYASVSALLYFIAVVIGCLAILTMLYLRWYSDRIYSDGVYLFYTFVGMVFFLFSSGGVFFHVPTPGAIWVSALMFIAIAYGAVTSFIMFSRTDAVQIKHPPDDEAE